jgi:hypothetical protein
MRKLTLRDLLATLITAAVGLVVPPARARDAADTPSTPRRSTHERPALAGATAGTRRARES